MMGRPRLFVRLSGCNLYCRWCDTPYTWRFSDRHPHDGVRVYGRSRRVRGGIEDVLEALEAMPAPAIVFTGGEPLVQQRALVQVMAAVRETFPPVGFEFETNGTITPARELADFDPLFVVSPKLSGSGVAREHAVDTRTLATLAARRSAFKFVVTTPSDLEEIDALVDRLELPPERVWLMPCGTTVEALAAASPTVAEEALARGFGFSQRLHIQLYGDRPGT